jgi:hypothetical protein
LLRNLKREYEAKVPTKEQEQYQAIVVAGLKLMFSKQTSHFMQEFLDKAKQANPAQLPRMIAAGLVKLISVIHNQTQGRMSQEAGVYAALVLMCYALEVLEEVLPQLKVNEDMVDRIATETMGGYMSLFGIDKDKIKSAIREGTPQQPNPDGSMPPPPQAQGGPVGGQAPPSARSRQDPGTTLGGV